MENAMEALRIVAGSWPIAVIVVGVTFGVVIRRSLYQVTNNAHVEKLNRDNGNKAVVVHGRSS